MKLEHITEALSRSPGFLSIADGLDGERHVVGAPDAAKPVTIAALARAHGGPVLVLTPSTTTATALIEELPHWLGAGRVVLQLPEHGTLPFERQLPPPGMERERLGTIGALRSGEPVVVVASARAVAQRTIPPDRFTLVELRKGARLAQEALLRTLFQLGYAIEPLADRPGTCSRRGGIIDIYPPASDVPFRVEWWGDEIESLGEYDPVTQRSGASMERAAIGPASEHIAAFDGEAITRLRSMLDTSGMGDEARQRYEDELDNLGEGGEADAFWAPFLLQATPLDHVPQEALIIVDEPADIAAIIAEATRAANAERTDGEAAGDIPRGLPLPFSTWEELSTAIEARPRRLDLARWASGDQPDQPAGQTGAIRLPFNTAPAFGGQLRSLVAEAVRLARTGSAVVIASQQAPRLRELFQEAGREAAPEGEPLEAGSVTVARGTLTGGWTLPETDGAPPLVLLTDMEVFGFRKQRRPLPRREPRASLSLLSEIEPGQFVVHVEHGIARFSGLVRRRTSDGAEREYLELHYAEGDRLFVPTDQIDRVSRYVGPSEHPPSLTRLGSTDWSRAKDRVRRAVAELAQDLVQLYAERELAEGHAFSPDTPWQQELEASFPYVETGDQLEAIRATKADMERARPMDRLVCGDVGYGKTEVAIRAAFKAVNDGMQVAVLVPTTVLAQQHFSTFTERLAPFPLRIEVLSRFRSEREQRAVVAGLADGSVDIVIGTHRLLQRDITFQNLGLVIIDEEQRFGVLHKERLKQIRREVDVLTLTATPIPRTLHMALAGIRDMSSIETPPEARQPVRTYVAEYDDRMVREAIQREIERGGQVYFVHNRVQNIEYMAERLRQSVPEATIVVGHGQMHEDQLERVMLEFARGDADVLVCTTIIESGIDIPNVNTIIINRADAMGLAQLYQLRGRVGRSAARAYAYLLYDKGRVPSDVARRRLQAIFEAQELGAGLRIALNDLEIRGAGNLLGAEQSGQIAAVGFELYTRMLADAVERLRALRQGEPPPRPRPATEISFDLPVTAYLPDTYVPDLPLRLALYQRLAEVRTAAEAADLARELRDRFGPLPPAAQELVYVAGLRAAAQAAGVAGIARENGTLVMKLGDAVREGLTPARRSALERALPNGVRIGNAVLRLDLSTLGDSWQETLLDAVGRLAPPDGDSAVAARLSP